MGDAVPPLGDANGGRIALIGRRIAPHCYILETKTDQVSTCDNDDLLEEFDV
jgi:hypothetical protein